MHNLKNSINGICQTCHGRRGLLGRKLAMALRLDDTSKLSRPQNYNLIRYHSTSKSKLFPSASPLSAVQEPLETEQKSSDDLTSFENLLHHREDFHERHIGPQPEDIEQMLKTLGYDSLDDLTDDTVPEQIRFSRRLQLPEAISEYELIEDFRKLADENESIKWRSYIGQGYYGCITPPAIMRNIFENPGWTTAYTAYQAEIAQGRLESLMNYQTMVTDLTGMEVSNASLLDEATAAAEALQVCTRQDKRKRSRWLVSRHCFPQTLAVVKTRAGALDIQVDEFDELAHDIQINFDKYSGLLVQYPNAKGFITNSEKLFESAHSSKCLVVVATDLMACTLLKPPGELGADLCVGSSQRFGVPLNYGGPHAGFLSCKKELMRSIPGRIVGMTRDSNGNMAYRFALQTREQHIRRDKATSNICTAQALLANMSAMYGVYHGPIGLKRIASSIHQRTSFLAHLIGKQLNNDGSRIENANSFFDTLTISADNCNKLDQIKRRAVNERINLRIDKDAKSIGISVDETTRFSDILKLANLFHDEQESSNGKQLPEDNMLLQIPLESDLAHLKRSSLYMQHPVFNSCNSEAQLVRYMKKLENKDVSLVHSMIPLGSCTMKLNATCQMLASSMPEFANCHPFQPQSQVAGYLKLINRLERYLCEITGYDKISFQPNSGAQGEYAGLRCIRSYLSSINQSHRDICLIPVSAHGTNPASAQMAGFKIIPVKVDMTYGNIDMKDLQTQIERHRDNLACLMVTYPSTFGVFDLEIKQICDLIHEAGGQVYLDGANMNPQIGLCRPGDYGSDVSHLNLHKTFCIPHGGGGPGCGPIGVKKHLAPFLPGHPLNQHDQGKSFGSVSASEFGSPAILPISYAYIRLMSHNLKKASQVSILNANYMMHRLANNYKISFKGPGGLVAHEFIIDCSEFKKSANIEAIDISKRLQDFGFHAPTVSWPITNSLMIEPTECEDKLMLDAYCDALLTIRKEISDIQEGKLDMRINPIKMAPHTQEVVCSDHWDRPYPRKMAAFPGNLDSSTKRWPTVGRVDDTYGDTHLMCTCPSVGSYVDETKSN